MTAESLRAKKCQPCEGGVTALTPEQAQSLVAELSGWELADDGRRIVKALTAKDFAAAIAYFQRVAELAENENHHPDLHLEGYRQVRVELTTHAIGGLSENDFILAAKIDALPFEARKSRS